MQKRVLFLLFLGVALWTIATRARQSDTGNAHEWPQHADGCWWLNLKPMDKIFFVQGFTGAADMPPSVGTSGMKPDCAQIVVSLVESLNKRNDFTHATVGQYREGLDKFYSDYANKLVLVSHAIYYVRDEVGGVPRPELEKQLEILRREQ